MAQTGVPTLLTMKKPMESGEFVEQVAQPGTDDARCRDGLDMSTRRVRQPARVLVIFHGDAKRGRKHIRISSWNRKRCVLTLVVGDRRDRSRQSGRPQRGPSRPLRP